MAGAVDTLFLPFQKGELELPSENQQFLFLNAAVPPVKDDIWKKYSRCEQHDRGKWLELDALGYHVSAHLDDADISFGGALILLSKHKRENQAMIARANCKVGEGRMIVVAGDKNLGISSVRKWVANTHTVIGSMAKNHATVFWFSANPKQKFELAEDGAKFTEFFTAPGMFSHEKIDKGSALLAEFIDSEIKGEVADFGAGWGYLSHVLLKKAKPRSLDLFETHFPSLESAKENLEQWSEVPLVFNWCDLTREPVRKRFEFIVMNPPFHTGRKTEPELGEQFIEIAAKSLKKNGTLLLVANTGLPYEKHLERQFRTVECLVRRDGFKVLKAKA